MEAMTPFFLMIRDLDGFEMVCFWLAVFVGLYVRYNFMTPYLRYEPYLSFGLLFAAPVLLVVTLSFMRTRVF